MTIRPLSDPGAAGRVAPFAVVGIVAVVLLLLPSQSSNGSELAVGAALMMFLLAVALLMPWARLPDWCQATPALISFIVLALVRHGGGGATSGYAPLVVLPVLWLAIFGSRTQLRLAVVVTAATFFGPLLLVGPPLYPADGWREAVLWVAIVLLVGTSTQTLVHNSRRRAADVTALGALMRALSAGSDPRPELCAAAQDVTDAAFVVLFEPQADGDLVATAATDELDLALMRIDPSAEASATAEVWRTGTRIYVADAVADPRASTRMVKLTGAKAALFQPVTREGHITAVLVVGFYQRRLGIPEQEVFLVELLAAEIGAAIDRANLVALLDSQSRIDPLTGAANRRSWDEELDRELARARRTTAPLTVAILDMDHFKAYNDTFGHVAGDLLLKELVSAIRAELRTGDIIARWGGEEFALAFLDCDLAQAHTIATRVLHVIPSGQTASIGLTQSRDHDTPRALIERADHALYTAKDNGRNQVKTYDAPPMLGLVRDDDA
ncbi:MAG: diguanylate cyclase [Propionicimonas sp.]